MNERIKLLADEAGITTNLDTDYYEKDMNKWVDYFSEKFALLIVRECQKLNSKELSITAIERLLPLYREHFGVEE
jgi:hypothetical protein